MKAPANFWQKLPKPFFVLAPMANVTDSAFRRLFAKYGKPDVTWTEFVSADGLVSPGRKNLLHDLEYSEKERPIVAQLFTGHPEAMKKAAALAKKLGFDGLDINMGCPDRSVEKQGGGAAHIRDPKTALEVIQAAREGFGSAGAPGLVSVKTRLGYNRVEMDWLRTLLSLEPRLPALTVHLRTRKEMSEVAAHWELMPEIMKMRDEIQADVPADERTLILGNGDVASLADADEKARKYGCDGIMIGRGIFGKPWFFRALKEIRKRKNGKNDTNNKGDKGAIKDKILSGGERYIPLSRYVLKHITPELEGSQPSPEERLKIMLEHTKLFEKTFCGKMGKDGKLARGIKNFAVMKKHFKAYVNGWDNAKELRAELMETENAKEVAAIVKEHMKVLK